MNAATHYPMLAAQAAAHAMAAAQSTSVEANRGREALLANVRMGINAGMPIMENGRAYKVSQHLAECGRDQQALLFAACYAAMSDRSAEEVKARLEAFVHAVAREYGEDSSELWSE